jgi:ABC-2 type transport system ATP-binding protein
MANQALVSCERVCLSYDGLRQAVADLSFEVHAGSIFALVGPNGAGKTSTLRMLATLADPTSGKIRIDGIDGAADVESVRRRVGYLPDNFALYDAMTPVDYLDFFARCYGVPAEVRKKRADELLEEFDLVEKRGSPIRTLSRGMRQRLGVAKTLVHDPRVLLLDEPASALDPGARLKLREALGRLRRRNLAVIISSHILPDLAGLADAVGIMEGGRMVQCGAIDEVAERVAGEAGEQVYRFEVHDHADKARRVFVEKSSKFEEPKPGVFEVSLAGGDEAVAELVEQLVLRGARISHVAPRESALEAVYRASAASKVA